MDVLERIAFDRLGVVVAPGGGTEPVVAAAVIAELARVGVRFSNPGAITDGVAAGLAGVVAHVRELRGEKGDYSPLFPGFPERLPDVDLGVARFLITELRLIGTERTTDDLRAARDFSDVGWWPASSVPQDVERARADRAAQAMLPGDERVEWLTVRLAGEAEMRDGLRAYLRDCFASAASLRDDVKADLRVLVAMLGAGDIDLSTVRFRENRTLLFELIWDHDRGRLPGTGATPDDLLRLFAALTGGDVSLVEKVRYPRLSRADRRLVVRTLEASDRLSDVFRRRGLWLAIDRGLHVGEFTAPRVQEVFARLRDGRHDRTSFPSRFERLLATDFGAAVALASAESPGLLGRGLRRLAAVASGPADREALVAAVAGAGARIPVRVLLAARAQLADNGATYPRVVFTVDGTSLPIVRPSGHLAVDAAFRDRLLSTLDAAIDAQLAARGSWAGQTVHIAAELEQLLVPDQLRTTAQGVVQIERGSRLPVGEAAVVRLFVHWREDDAVSDLDLSCLALDDKFRLAGHVSWTNLADGVMTHSGDLTSAPDGAQEFLDIDVAKARTEGRERGWRYLVPAVFRYSGPAFDRLAEAYVGWMLRDRASSDRRTFDPATVANAFALTGRRRYAVPMLFDLLTDEILYVDVYLNGEGQARVERDGRSVSSLVRSVAARRNTKATVAELARRHVRARGGELVDDPARATVTFGVGRGCTYDALHPERILADLL